MKAILCKKYGGSENLVYDEYEKPQPKANQVLVKVYSSSINYMDAGFIKGEPFMVRLWSGLFKPKNPVPGADVAGVIEKTGSNVTRFKPGDEIFGELGLDGLGCYAEYVCAPEKSITHKPRSVEFIDAGCLGIAGVTAMLCVKDKGNTRPGDDVLINGSSGSVGMFALLIAKALGAKVTAVCSTKHIDTVKKAGADSVIDYTKEDFRNCGKKFDRIFGINGDCSLSDYKKLLKDGGIYVCSGGSGRQIAESMILGGLYSLTGNKKLTSLGMATGGQKVLEELVEFFTDGKIKAVIDKVFQLRDTAQAMDYFENGRPTGKIAIEVVNK
jgi:NADPH:quinone reductase-like Zn-dependent oxidoreductase